MRWLLLAASVAFSLVLGELVARLVIPEVTIQREVRDGGIVVPYRPGASADFLTDEFRVRFAVNRFGYRDRLDRRAERTPGVPRVALLGDSFSAGWGVELEQTFAYRFEEATGIEVVNAARHGGSPLWYVIQSRRVRDRFHPDWLLVQLFDNDPSDNVRHARSFPLSVGDRVGELPESLRPPHGLLAWLGDRWSRLVLPQRFRALVRRIEGRTVVRSPCVRPGARPGARILSREESIAAHHVDFSPDSPWEGRFGFHDPARQDAWRERLAWNEQLLEQLLQEAEQAGVPVAILYIPDYAIFFREPTASPLADGLRALAERHGAPWIDAREIFADHPRPWELYYAYDRHLNAEGHAALGRALVRELAPRVTGARAAL